MARPRAACPPCGLRKAARRASFRRAASCRPTIIARRNASSSFQPGTRISSRSGFTAKEEKDEAKCPDFELNQLIAISDVTARVQDADRGQGRRGLHGGQARGQGRDRQGMHRRRRRLSLRCRRALQRRRLQPLQIPPLPGCAPCVRAGAGDRVLRRRPGQFRVPAL